MDKMKSAHVESHNMIEVHCDCHQAEKIQESSILFYIY